MVLVFAAVTLAVLLVLALVWLNRAPQARRTANPNRLPAGADAALWSIVEAVPDPRNHLALTRDLTGEVRVTGTVLDEDFRVSTLRPPPPPIPAGGSSVRIIGAPNQNDDAVEQAS